jgi:hypothetical protein
MPVFATGLLTSDEDFPLHGRLIALARDLEPRSGAYELYCGDEGAAVVFVVYHQGEPVDLRGYSVQLLADNLPGSPFALENAPEAEPPADASRGEVRWVVPAEVTQSPRVFRAQVVVSQAGGVNRASNVLHFRVRPRVGEEA